MTAKLKHRIIIYNKYNGHCAYCGMEIKYKDMQVDHIICQAYPQTLFGKDVHDEENLMPSCRKCNHYKRAHSLEQFRHLIKTIHDRLHKIYIFEVAMNYGIVEVKPFDGMFYFEQMEIKKGLREQAS